MKILITGARGQLAQEYQRIIPLSGHTVLAPSEESLDIVDAASIRAIMDELHPDIVINCAAYNNVDKAESDVEMAHRVNGLDLRAWQFLARSTEHCLFITAPIMFLTVEKKAFILKTT